MSAAKVLLRLILGLHQLQVANGSVGRVNRPPSTPWHVEICSGFNPGIPHVKAPPCPAFAHLFPGPKLPRASLIDPTFTRNFISSESYSCPRYHHQCLYSYSGSAPDGDAEPSQFRRLFLDLPSIFPLLFFPQILKASHCSTCAQCERTRGSNASSSLHKPVVFID
jgi:hypothetical protein